MKNLVIFLIFISFNNIFGQTTHFFKDNARWVYQTSESYEPGQLNVYSALEENNIKGDSIIEGTIYKKLYKRYLHTNTIIPPSPFPSTSSTYLEQKGPSYIRYDDTVNKAYFKEHADSTEIIIYDGNLKVGDTLPFTNPYNVRLFQVLRIDTFTYFGKPTKKFVLDTSYLPIRNAVIEGIGGLNGLTYHRPVFGALGGGLLMTDLVCFEYNDSTYQNTWPALNSIPCLSSSNFNVATNEPEKENSINIFPNPTDGKFLVQVPDNLLGSNFTMYNEVGVLVSKTKLIDVKNEIVIRQPGIYHYQIINHLGRTISGKIYVIH